MVLKTQESKDKLNLLVDKYGRDAVNESIKKFGADKFEKGLEQTEKEKITPNLDNTVTNQGIIDNNPVSIKKDPAPKQETVENNKPADFGSGAFLTKDVTGNPTENKAKDFGSGSILPTDTTGNNKNNNTYEQPTQTEKPIQQKKEIKQPEQIVEQKPEELKGGLKKYKGAGADTILSGLNTSDLTVGSKQWDKLIEANGGEETPAMVKARKDYEMQTKLNITNKDNRKILNQDKEEKTQKQKTQEEIDKLDLSYTKSLKKIFGDKDKAYKTYKEGNEEVNNLQDELESKSDEIDDLNDTKRDIMDEVKHDYPGMSKSHQLVLYNDRVKAIDDQIYTLTKEYNTTLGDYKYESQKVQDDYTAGVKKADEEYKVAQDLYKTQRGDLLNEKKIEDAKISLEDERAYKEEQYQKALKDKDAEAAKKLKYDLALIDYKNKTNDDFSKKFKALGNGAYATYNDDTMQWEVSKIDTSADKTDSGSTSGTGNNSTGYDFIKNKEGFSETAYYDVNGYAIGYGQHTINGVPVKKGDTIDKDTADKDFENRINNASFNKLVDTNLTTSQEAALYDLEYNAGPGIWDTSNGKNIINAVNERDFDKAADIMANSGIATTNAATGEVMPSLVNRRKEASKLLVEPNNFKTLDVIDQGNIKNLAARMERNDSKAYKEAKELSQKDREALIEVKNKVNSLQNSDDKDIVNLYNMLIKGGAKISDLEGANLQSVVTDYALDGDKDKFITNLRNKTTDYLEDKSKGTGLTFGSLQTTLGSIDSFEEQLDTLDTDRFKQAIAEGQRALGTATKDGKVDRLGFTTSLNSLKSEEGLFLAKFIKSISGAAVTDEEFKRLSSLLFSEGDTPEAAKQKLDGFKRSSLNEFTDTYSTYLGGAEKGRKLLQTIYPEFNLDTKKETQPKPTGFSKWNSKTTLEQNYNTKGF